MNDIDQQGLMLPIYIDVRLMFDVLASLKNGLNTAEEIETIITTNDKTLENIRSLSANFKLGGLDIGANPMKSMESQDEKSESRRSSVKHTTGSLLNELRKEMYSKNLIKQLGNGINSAWESLSIADFVEVSGVFQSNPVETAINAVTPLMNFATESGLLPENPETKKLETAKNLLNSKFIRSDRKIFIIDIGKRGTHKATASLSTEKLYSQSSLELVDRELKIFGKITRKINELDKYSINLLTEIPLLRYLKKEKIQGILPSVSPINDFFDIPNIEIEVKGPVIDLLPIAIYI